MHEKIETRRVLESPWFYFLLVILLSLPFYVLGSTGSRLPFATLLPLSALLACVPILAALILVVWRSGINAIFVSVKRELDVAKVGGAVWYIIALVFMPLVCVLEFGALRLTGHSVPVPQINHGEALFLFVLFFIGAIGEEAGWQGYAYPALRKYLSVLSAAVVMGAFWAAWHIIPFLQLGRSADWIFWHSLNAVAMRIIMVWLFEKTGGSVLNAVLFHTMINVSWAVFPICGSFYDPFVTFAILMLCVGVLLAFWRPRAGNAP